MNLFEAMTGPIARMSYVNRYSSFPVNRRENVAEHSWWVSFIAFLIAQDVQLRTGRSIVWEMLFKRALLHDVSECLSGDIIRSYKHSNPSIERMMKLADEQNMDSLCEGIGEPAGTSVLVAWMAAKDDTIEGRIVAFADMAAVAFYCREEDRSGNRAIRQVLKEMYERWFHTFHEDKLFAPYMEQMFPTHRWPDMLREELVPAQLMYPQGIPVMRDHREGPVAEHTFEGTGQA